MIYLNALAQYTEQTAAYARAPALRPLAGGGLEAVNCGTAPHSQAEGFLRLQPVLPYFLRNRLQALPEFRTAVDTAFRHYYNILGGALTQVAQMSLVQRQMGLFLIAAEYENIYSRHSPCLGSAHFNPQYLPPIDAVP